VEVLRGMRIVEGSAFVAAPLGGMTLAQLGADVIRFDAIGGGIDYHRWPVTPDGTSLFWAGMTKGNAPLRLTFADPKDKSSSRRSSAQKDPMPGSSCPTSQRPVGYPTNGCVLGALI